MNKEIPVIACRDLSKSYHEKYIDVDVFCDLNFDVTPGELISIVGASGSGKSTLLHLLGGLDKPTAGEVLWVGQAINSLSEANISRLRNAALGFVYQFHHLLPEFTALENVAIPLLIGKMSASEAKQKAAHLLDHVGLGDRLYHRVAELSGGERQRTAIARALVTDPQCVLADEPTGNLDKKTADKVFDVMQELQASLGTSIVMVTHDDNLASRATSSYRIDEGKLFQV